MLRRYSCVRSQRENDLEKLFLHYATGGLSLDGKAANSYLKLADETVARR